MGVERHGCLGIVESQKETGMDGMLETTGILGFRWWRFEPSG
jgi:hypothetical protein